MAAPGSSKIACKVKQELMEQVKRLGREMAAVQMKEVEALVNGVPFDAELHLENAKDLRKLLMERLRNHIAEHGC